MKIVCTAKAGQAVLVILSSLWILGNYVVLEQWMRGLTSRVLLTSDNHQVQEVVAATHETAVSVSMHSNLRSKASTDMDFSNGSGVYQMDYATVKASNVVGGDSLKLNTANNNNSNNNNHNAAVSTLSNKAVEEKKASDSEAPRGRWAYSFLVGGCNPEQPAYRGYIYDMLIATKIFRETGSKADVVAFVQMSRDTNATKLPDQDSRYLKAMRVKIKYIPKTEHESFYRLNLIDQFRVLELTEYSRVFMLDGDVMPTGNLDYIFELSEKGVIQSNFISAGKSEAANGGFFMLKPETGGLRRINDIIAAKDERGRNLPPPHHWDNVFGWGHAIEAPDRWRTTKTEGKKWTFYDAAGGQGLLYYWTKYEKRDVTIVVGNEFENWANGTLLDTKHSILNGYSNPIKVFKGSCGIRLGTCDAPHGDYRHFTGKEKPWLVDKAPDNFSRKDSMDSPEHMWFHYLSLVNQELGMGLDLTNWG